MSTEDALRDLKDINSGKRPLIVTKGVSDIINNPSHYTQGGIEVREFLEANGIAEDFYVGNIIKYLIRYRYKAGLVDLRKALRYCEMLVEMKLRIDKENAERAGTATTS
ncbi:DUF3310 domain-containing protein [Ferrovibrio sp.]|uniref:DUF3310 domain-containing protein n=1 Tax=Ferrovibrio sp. TaxID=1917215 RepID=UPI0035B2137E